MSDFSLDEVLRRDHPFTSADQIECIRMFCDWRRGYHHVLGKFKPCGISGVEINHASCMDASTFDFNRLTILVFMAHDRCIRVEILPANPGRLKYRLHKRHSRDGSVSERHPTIETALTEYRMVWPLEEGRG